MNFDIPIYIEKLTEGYFLRPLFTEAPRVYHRDLDLGTHRLERACRKAMFEMAKDTNHQELADIAFYPALERQRFTFSFGLKNHHVSLSAMVVTFDAFDQKLAFFPTFDNLSFTLLRNESLEQRANEVLFEYIKELADDEGQAFNPETIRLGSKEWIGDIDVEIALPRIKKKASHTGPSLASRASATELNGAEELAHVGRSLKSRYPGKLYRCIHRDKEIAALERLTGAKERPPVLIVGPHKVGKTALIHEMIYRQMANREPGDKSPDCVLLTPGRLIAGMSYVGQWEERVLVIIAHTKKKGHILYFDDFLGLYKAGVSANAKLCIADLIREPIIDRQIRVVVEMTESQLRLFAERDRSLVDAFHIIRLAPTTETQTLDIGIDTLRNLEGRYENEFHPDALTKAISLQHRFNRVQAMPGKLAAFLETVAKRHKKQPINLDTIIQDFSALTGLTVSFLDQRVPLKRETVISALEAEVLGQKEAVHALADVVMVGKAGLQDAGRPMGSLLFLGPTGVGKTESAKAVTRFLFKDEDRLLRFDLNEYGDADAVARLIGSFHRRSGLLTSAVKRQPFSVVLFDEIEKASPDVFNLLLQVLDDGRLTDAAGEVCDFSSTIIIMTSNLGAAQAQKPIGYGSQNQDRSQVFEGAAKRFFRPEFFNRIDRIVPFSPIDKTSLTAIADLLLNRMLRRSGLSRRKCVLVLPSDVKEKLLEIGYQPAFGARALKRTLERDLMRPVAVQLAASSADKITLIQTSLKNDGIDLSVIPIETAKREEDLSLSESLPLKEQLRHIHTQIERVRDTHQKQMPDQQFSIETVSKETEAYLRRQEAIEIFREELEMLEEQLEDADIISAIKVSKMRPKPTQADRWGKFPQNVEFIAASSFADQLNELTLSSFTRPDLLSEEATAIAIGIEGIERQMLSQAEQSKEGVFISLMSTHDEPALYQTVMQGLTTLLAASEIVETTDTTLLVKGKGVFDIARWEEGVHLFETQNGTIQLVACQVVPITLPYQCQTPPLSIGDMIQERALPLIRIYTGAEKVFDLRWGLLADKRQTFFSKMRSEVMQRLQAQQDRG